MCKSLLCLVNKLVTDSTIRTNLLYSQNGLILANNIHREKFILIIFD